MIDRSRLRARKPRIQLIKALLGPNEEIVWRGQPIARHLLFTQIAGRTGAARIFYLLIGLLVIQPFSLSGIYLCYTALLRLLSPTSAGSFAGLFFGLCAGLLLAAGPYYFAWRPGLEAFRKAKYVEYVLTNRRAMILYIREGQVQDQHIKGLQHLSQPWLKRARSSGIGDVIFDAGGALHNEGFGSGYSTHYDIGFEAVPDARQVFKLFLATIPDRNKRRKTEAA